MIFIVNAENRAHFEAELKEMHRQRKAVFIDQMGWQLSVRGDMEVDAYDRPDTVYLIACSDKTGDVLASARLLPTIRPHLMSDVFPHTCCGGCPISLAIWEASRFCTSTLVRGPRSRLLLLWQTFCAIMETTLLFGVEQIIFTANSALLPLALNCGWRASLLGPTLPDGDDQVTAVSVRMTTDGLGVLRQRFGITGPVTRFVAPKLRIAA